jgi:hypothetical protein
MTNGFNCIFLKKKGSHHDYGCMFLLFFPNAREKKVWACSYVTSVLQTLQPKYYSIFGEELSDFDEI